VRRTDPLLVALGLLTLVTGLVDAACYLGLGRVFTANMTGNVVLLASGAAGTDGLPVLGPTVSLLVFLVGAAGLVAIGLPLDSGGGRRYVVIGLLAAAVVIALAAVALRLGRSRETT
jgi:uncharacterized membrane protein YoaK (UPF0700 family)